MDRFARPSGTQDILPDEQPYWEFITAQITTKARDYGFVRIDTPMFESTELFARGVGAGTDIVEKEMYSFVDKGERALTLRPEFTAGVVRAYIENGMHVLPKPVKLYSIGPSFRYERPQAGRYRQFHQFNAEIFGVQDPLADLEIMLLAWDIYEVLGFKDLAFQLNSTGCPACRPGYIAQLQDHYHAHLDVICEDCQRRLEQNPLRLLDCKRDQCQPLIETAPKIRVFLCAECAEHFDVLLGHLDSLQKPYTINHRLVRGLDYYTKTVFEVWAEGIGAQAAVCGGGRYDGLVELLGGQPTPGVGFAIGLERLVLVLKAQDVNVPAIPRPPVFIAFLGAASREKAIQLLGEIRRAGLGAQIAMGGSLRSQLRQADRSGASFAVIIGEDELTQGIATLRDLRTGDQQSILLSAVAETLLARTGTAQ